MVKIAIFGHSADSFSNIRSVINDIDNAIAIIKRQHKENDFSFLLNCEPGVSQWFCSILMEQQLPYEIFLSSSPDVVSERWSEEQRDGLIWLLNAAKAIHMTNMNNSYESCIMRDMEIINNSQWCLFFWNGKHQGITYNALKYAIENNKIVYNGCGELKVIDGNVLKIGE